MDRNWDRGVSFSLDTPSNVVERRTRHSVSDEVFSAYADDSSPIFSITWMKKKEYMNSEDPSYILGKVFATYPVVVFRSHTVLHSIEGTFAVPHRCRDVFELALK